MSDRAWEDLIDRIDIHFGILNSRKFDQPIEGDNRLVSHVDQVDFEKDAKQYRVERISSPAVIDKKTTYSKTGVATRTQVVYDEDELTNKVAFYQLNGDDVNEISPEQLLG